MMPAPDPTFETRLYLDSGSGYRAEQSVSRPIEPGDFTIEFPLGDTAGLQHVRWDPVEGQPCRCRVDAVDTDGRYGGIRWKNTWWTTEGLDEFLTDDPQYELDGDFRGATFIRLRGRLELWEPDQLIDALMKARETAEQEQRRATQIRNEAESTRARAEHYLRLADDLRRERDIMRGSWSWRLTQPLRFLHRVCGLTRHDRRAGEADRAIPMTRLPYRPDTRVSIAVPVHNGERYLADTLNSIIRQSHKALDIVVADDASSDGSMAIAESFARRDPRVRVLRGDGRLGMVGNWNRALGACTGEWVLLCGQDDALEPDAIESALRAACADVRVILAARQFTFESSTQRRLRFSYAWELPTLETLNAREGVVTPDDVAAMMARLSSPCINFIGEPVCGLVRRDVYEHYGPYHAQLSQLADYEFWLRCVLNEPFVYVARRLFNFRVHGGSATQSNLSDRVRGVHLEYAVLLLELLEGVHHLETRARHEYLVKMWGDALDGELLILRRRMKRDERAADAVHQAAARYPALARRLRESVSARRRIALFFHWLSAQRRRFGPAAFGRHVRRSPTASQ